MTWVFLCFWLYLPDIKIITTSQGVCVCVCVCAVAAKVLAFPDLFGFFTILSLNRGVVVLGFFVRESQSTLPGRFKQPHRIRALEIRKHSRVIPGTPNNGTPLW